jgi:DNA-binding MarR family transcriptional regulator
VDKSLLRTNLSWLFLKVSFRSKQSLITIAEEHELTLPQLYALIFMNADKALKMNELATLLHCDPSNVTGIIDRMFAQKDIERRENPNDRRAKLVSLTPKGVDLQSEVLKKIFANEPKMFAALDAAEKKQLLTLLLKLAA